MGRRKSKPRGANATCCHCGRWATSVCSACDRPICDRCKREWPTLKDDGREVTIVTCTASKCQKTISAEDRKRAAEILSLEDWA